ESDTARLFDLVGDSCAILCLPTGAKTFKAEWAREIPRGAVALLCHDGDQDGDSGADKAARILGGKTVRVRPPPDVKDWCDWTGGRDEFVALVNAAKSVTVNVDGLAWERLSAIAMRSIVFVDKPLL